MRRAGHLFPRIRIPRGEEWGQMHDNLRRRQIHVDGLDAIEQSVLSFHELGERARKLRQNRNENNKAMKKRVKDKQNTDDLRERGRELKRKVEECEDRLKKVEEDMLATCQHLPNLISAQSLGVEEPTVLYCKGDKVEADPQRDHMTLNDELGFHIFDLHAASQVTGSKFTYLVGNGVKLEQALLSYVYNKIEGTGYQLISCPDLLQQVYIDACGYQPRDASSSQIYHLEDEMSLIGTAEVSIAAKYSQSRLQEADLPIKWLGSSHCFRKEAGGHGLRDKGLYRLHQFTKLELFSFNKPEDDSRIFDEMLAIQEDILQGLGLHYQVVEMPPYELGNPAYRKVDVEAWMPGKGGYGEVGSTSLCTDYQSRRLNIKYNDKEGKGVGYVHTINGTALAIPRIMLSLLETYFDPEERCIRIPAVLQPYMQVDRVHPVEMPHIYRESGSEFIKHTSQGP